MTRRIVPLSLVVVSACAGGRDPGPGVVETGAGAPGAYTVSVTDGPEPSGAADTDETGHSEDTDTGSDGLVWGAGECVSVLGASVRIGAPDAAYTFVSGAVGTPWPVDDVTGDGVADVVLVGPWGATDNEGNAFGANFLLPGPLVGEVDPIAAAVFSFGGLSEGEFNGSQPWQALTADFDGDGVRDLGVPLDHDLVVYHGPLSADSEPTLALGWTYGAWLADFDSDGRDELVVQGYDTVSVVPLPLPEGHVDPATIAVLTVSVAGCSGCDASLQGVADLTGDGVPDLLVHAGNSSGWDQTLHVVDGTLRGEVSVLDQPELTPPPYSGDRSVSARVVPDFTGDGAADVVVWVSDPRAQVWVVPGPIPAGADVEASAVRSFLDAGAPVAADLDGDGRSDLVFGQPYDDFAGVDAGAAFVFYGGTTGTSVLAGADRVIVGDVPMRRAGSALVAVPDVDGDGADELAVGAAWEDVHPSWVWIVPGGAAAEVVWRRDVDGDGFGDDLDAVTSSCPVPGYTSEGGDCDDGDAAIHPATEWFVDADGDGFGGALVAVGCVGPVGAVMVSGDCDDVSSAIGPTVAEVCDDGIDQDCDGVDDCARVGLDDVRFGVLTGASPDQRLYRAYGLGDVDGDGFADLGVASPAYERTGAALLVVRGPIVGDAEAADAAWLTVPVPDLGSPSMVPAGDVDGDGHADVIVGARVMNRLYAGRRAGLEFAGDGVEAAFVGEVTGDGVVDVVNYGGSVLPTLVVAGRSATVAAPLEFPRTDPLAVGDLDGDGVDDLVLGDLEYDRDGRAWVLYGPLLVGGAPDDVADVVISGPPGGDEFGAAGAIADLDGSGAPDLVVGALNVTNADEGVWVFAGPLAAGARSTSDAAAVISDPGSTGLDVVAPGDLDGDGAGDLVVASRTIVASVYGPFVGAVALGGLSPDAGAKVDIGAYYTYLFAVGDLSGDGVPDVGLGLSGADGVVAPRAGAVWLLSGASL
jgi:hypothetical protein